MSVKYFPAIMAGFMLTACAGKADFGRYRADEIDHVTSFVRSLTDLEETQQSSIALTEDEKHLRMVARILENSKPGLTPSMDFSVWLASLSGQEPDPKIYYGRLQATYHNSPNALLNALSGHIHDDNALIGSFASQSVKVTKADTERLAAVQQEAGHGSLDRNTLITRATNVVFRANENNEVMEAAVMHLDNRLAGYKYALSSARLEIPDRDNLAIIEKAIGGMEKRVAGLRGDIDRHTAIVRGFFGPSASTSAAPTASASPEKSS